MIQIGIDEVGRGSWAGPLVVAAVCFPTSVKSKDFKGICIRDSKLLSPFQREQAASIIRKFALIQIEYVSHLQIDELGIQGALVLAINHLVSEISAKLPTDDGYKFWIDGRRICNLPYNHEFIIKGDSIMPIISAASIVAKVDRDVHMTKIAHEYPVYGFDRHKGYGTAHHQTMLQTHGPCSIHRKSYKPIANLLAD